MIVSVNETGFALPAVQRDPEFVQPDGLDSV